MEAMYYLGRLELLQFLAEAVQHLGAKHLRRDSQTASNHSQYEPQLLGDASDPIRA